MYLRGVKESKKRNGDQDCGFNPFIHAALSTPVMSSYVLVNS